MASVSLVTESDASLAYVAFDMPWAAASAGRFAVDCCNGADADGSQIVVSPHDGRVAALRNRNASDALTWHSSVDGGIVRITPA